MIGKNWKIIEFYKDMLIYEKNNKLYFGNRSYTNARPKSVRSAKILITKHINRLNTNKKNSLKYLKYEF